jgi:hypothetical protein
MCTAYPIAWSLTNALALEWVMVDFSFGSKVSLRGAFDPRPELGVEPKQNARKLTFALECPKLEVFSPWLMPCQNGKS